MKIYSVLNIVLFFLLCMNSNAQVDFKLMPIVDAAAQAKEQNKLVFVEFTAEGCPPCVVMEKEVFSNPTFGNLINERFIAVKSNGLTTNSKFEKMRHKIHGFPTIVYFDGNGIEIFRVEGKRTLEEMLTLSNLILEGNIERAIELFPLPVHQEQIFSKDSIPQNGPIKKPE